MWALKRGIKFLLIGVIKCFVDFAFTDMVILINCVSLHTSLWGINSIIQPYAPLWLIIEKVRHVVGKRTNKKINNK